MKESIYILLSCMVCLTVDRFQNSNGDLLLLNPNNGFVSMDHHSGPIDTSYTFSKKYIANIKSRIRLDRITEDSLSHLFTNLLIDHIIPHWLGTPWSFQGHTSIPRSGEIACGYFVSTTLKDVGFNLNRYTFAQQLPINEGKTLSLGSPLLEINSNSTTERIAILRDKLKEGIYFIGFDQSHVGYIQKKNCELFVIHSNYIGAEGVVIERIEDSQVFSYYTQIYIADISRNTALMRKWVKSEVVAVVTN
ncbi:MAG: hypothetical protein IPP25_16000 [Saprospiraceae bacterium]|nr:hypothetical protein [Candidatus Opimibacter skivensis]